MLTPDYTEIHVHVFESLYNHDTCMLTYVII